MFDFYESYYRATETSAAYAALCERAFGRNFAQHGFADMDQLDFLIHVANLGKDSRVLDLGCGNGGMADYISGVTGAHVIGVDFSPEAIRQAQARAERKPGRLAFQVADIGALPFDGDSFDTVISIDTLYFGEPDALLAQIRNVLAPGGRLLAYYTHAADPMTPIPVFPKETLPVDKTPIAGALARQGFAYKAWNFSRADYRHARLLRETLDVLRPAFEAEGNLFLYENRIGEAAGVMAAVEAGCHARYLYCATRAEAPR